MADLFEHTEYRAAPTAFQWAAAHDLAGLWYALKLEAWGKQGHRATRVLPTGLIVSVWVITEGNLSMRRLVSLRRRTSIDGAPVTAEAWEHEVQETLTAFGAARWRGASKEPGNGRWIELYPGEINFGTGPCQQCGRETAQTNGLRTMCEGCVARAKSGAPMAGGVFA